jgi:hypothetical protein
LMSESVLIVSREDQEKLSGPSSVDRKENFKTTPEDRKRDTSSEDTRARRTVLSTNFFSISGNLRTLFSVLCFGLCNTFLTLPLR